MEVKSHPDMMRVLRASRWLHSLGGEVRVVNPAEPGWIDTGASRMEWVKGGKVVYTKLITPDMRCGDYVLESLTRDDRGNHRATWVEEHPGDEVSRPLVWLSCDVSQSGAASSAKSSLEKKPKATAVTKRVKKSAPKQNARSQAKAKTSNTITYTHEIDITESHELYCSGVQRHDDYGEIDGCNCGNYKGAYQLRPVPENDNDRNVIMVLKRGKQIGEIEGNESKDIHRLWAGGCTIRARGLKEVFTDGFELADFPVTLEIRGPKQVIEDVFVRKRPQY